jgi:hypothetical protein
VPSKNFSPSGARRNGRRSVDRRERGPIVPVYPAEHDDSSRVCGLLSSSEIQQWAMSRAEMLTDFHRRRGQMVRAPASRVA